VIENKELFFFLNAHQKIAFVRNDFPRAALMNYFALHKKSKNYGTRFLKYRFFQKLRFVKSFEGILQVIFH
jgi:hypothetical protein